MNHILVRLGPWDGRQTTQELFPVRIYIFQEAEKSSTEADWVFVGVAVAIYSLAIHYTCVCIVPGGEIAVCPTHGGAGTISGCQFGETGLNTLVTK